LLPPPGAMVAKHTPAQRGGVNVAAVGNVVLEVAPSRSAKCLGIVTPPTA
jgi:hypothetical protein